MIRRAPLRVEITPPCVREATRVPAEARPARTSALRAAKCAGYSSMGHPCDIEGVLAGGHAAARHADKVAAHQHADRVALTVPRDGDTNGCSP